MPYVTGHHASDEELEEYSLGRLEESHSETFEEHLLICPNCQDRLAEVDAFVRATRWAAGQLHVLPPPHRDGRGLARAFFRPAPALGLTVLILLAAWTGMRYWIPGMAAQAPFAVLLESNRAHGVGSAPARRLLRVEMRAEGLPAEPAFAAEIVDASGDPVLQGAARRSGDILTFTGERRFGPGTYWVRVYGGSRTLLREYGLKVE